MLHSKSEVGHALVVANFEKLYTNCSTVGGLYNPSMANLQIPNLMQSANDAQRIMEEVRNSRNSYSFVVNNRQDLFANLKPLCTKLIGALAGSGASAQIIKDAKAINKKIQGAGKHKPNANMLARNNANPIVNNVNPIVNNANPSVNNTNPPVNNANPPVNNANPIVNNANPIVNNANLSVNNANLSVNNVNPIVNTTSPRVNNTSLISINQQSYTQMVSNFAQLVNYLQQTPNYNPNERELQVPNLLRVLAELQSANSAMNVAEITLKNARIIRNEFLYNPITGLCAVAANVKEYTKSLLSASSPLYKEIKKIAFANNVKL